MRILSDVILVTDRLNIQSFMIGATARDLLMQDHFEISVPRATDDLDIGVAVKDWAAYEELKKILIRDHDMEQDRIQEQRLRQGLYKVDLVPYGGLEHRSGEIAFPPKGDFRMSTLGFPEAFDSAIRIEIDGIGFRVASLEGISILKFIAYSDRPAQRSKDIQDILFIARNYFDSGGEEHLYKSHSDLLTDTFDYRYSGARVLGRELRSIMTAETSSAVAGALDKLINLHDTSSESGRIFREIRLGLNDRPAPSKAT